MIFVLAGMFGLGGPEIAALFVLLATIAVPVAVVVLIVNAVGKRNRYSRYCPKCGRGLTQQTDAPFCSYCGDRLP
jgi:hypothetical protein